MHVRGASMQVGGYPMQATVFTCEVLVCKSEAHSAQQTCSHRVIAAVLLLSSPMQVPVLVLLLLLLLLLLFAAAPRASFTNIA